MKINKIKLGKLGILPVEIPYFQIGKGKPQGMLVALQHGGEHSPLLVIDEIIKKQKQLKGLLTIIPVTNPFGLLKNTRNEIIEDKDLNRQFPGNQSGDFSSRLAATILNLAQDKDFVIDLHTFSRQAPYLAGYTTGSLDNQNKIKKIISILKPDVVWQVNEDQGEDKRFKGTLDESLTKQQIPSVFIETPNILMIEDRMVKRISDSIINLVNNYEKQVDELKVPTYRAKYLYADTSGIFKPSVEVLEDVKAGQVVGTITELPDFKTKQVQSEIKGKVLTIKRKEVVRLGSKIASIGI